MCNRLASEPSRDEEGISSGLELSSRPGTPDGAQDRGLPVNARNPADPFVTPVSSAPGSQQCSMDNLPHAAQRRYFHSRRVKKGAIERPWLDKKDPREKWVTIIPLAGIFIGLCLTGLLVWDGMRSVVNHKYCPVLIEESFRGGLNPKIWTREAEVGGYGNGQFEETTTNNDNAFVEDGILYIKPTVRPQSLIENNNTVTDLFKSGTCSSTLYSNCVIHTNLSNGTIINPVASARISTRDGAKIKYGRIEVEAMLPEGDWLWPAIWMLPVDGSYGAWPRSGEIDIVESRGNNHTYALGGNNVVSSTIHWGPDAANDGWWHYSGRHEAQHTTYARRFHTFGLEWSEKYLYTYIGSRLLQVMYARFDAPMWDKGRFPPQGADGGRLDNPWAAAGSNSAPFDRDFYLVLDVAVGAANGWFEDGVAAKPWLDRSPSARLEFWNARARWRPTWERRGGAMAVRSVKMWQQQGYNGCGDQARRL